MMTITISRQTTTLMFWKCQKQAMTKWKATTKSKDLHPLKFCRKKEFFSTGPRRRNEPNKIQITCSQKFCWSALRASTNKIVTVQELHRSQLKMKIQPSHRAIFWSKLKTGRTNGKSTTLLFNALPLASPSRITFQKNFTYLCFTQTFTLKTKLLRTESALKIWPVTPSLNLCLLLFALVIRKYHFRTLCDQLSIRYQRSTLNTTTVWKVSSPGSTSKFNLTRRLSGPASETGW